MPPPNPIKDITFGSALNITLNNYYDLLKNQVGGLATEEYLQLKLVADTLDISEEKYKWFSYYNLVRRSDQAIEPSPVSGTVMTAVSTLAAEYEKFLRQLRSYIVRASLSADDQKKLAALDLDLERTKQQMRDWVKLDRADWKENAEAMGYQVGDMNAYIQWSNYYGHLRDIEQAMRRIREFEFDKKTILDKEYPEPSDREVINAEFDFENPTMRLRYPTYPDSEYPNGSQFNLTYLAMLPLGSSGMFDDRRMVSWNMSLGTMQTSEAGKFSAHFDRTTSQSDSVKTDWGYSGSVTYSFIKVSANVSESTQIQNDFSQGTAIDVSAAAAYKMAITYPPWFRPSLFNHKRVVDNIHDFEPFFGPNGSLLYVPTHLILVRGFKVEFTASQNWTYDYKRKFSASHGGGFNVFGIGFGSSASYSKEQKEHTIDVSNTKLTIADDPKTIRFVGYAVKKTTVFHPEVVNRIALSLGNEAVNSLQ